MQAFLPKIAALLVALVIAIGLGELALRLAWQNPFAAEAPDHLLKLRMQHSNTDHWVDRSAFDPDDPRTRLRADDRSYVLPSTVHADPDVTIAFLGGSTTVCSTVTEEMRFPNLVGRMLTDRGLKANVLNAARSSGTLHDSLNVLLNHVVTDRPDIAVVMHATNDIGLLSLPKGYEVRMGGPVELRDMGKWIAQMLSSRSYIAGLLRHTLTLGSGIVMGSDHAEKKNNPTDPDIPQEPFRQRLHAFIHLCRDFGIVPVLMTQPLANSQNALTPDWADMGNQDRFNVIVREVAASEGALLIDLVQHLQEDVPGWDEPMKVFFDGMHVTDEGSSIYASHIASRLLGQATEIAASRRQEQSLAARDDSKLPAVSAPPSASSQDAE